jgi:hypothetical protein
MKSASSILIAGQKYWHFWMLAGLIVAIIYMPLLLSGGIIADDWGDIRHTWKCIGFFECYKEWFPLFSNRPLAPLPLTLTTKLFSLHYSWYLFANTAIYLLALGLSANIFKPFLGPFARSLFFIFAAVPCIAMPLIVSPINQLTATVAFLYWAISLKLLLEHDRKNQWALYILAYLFLLCGFLTYEIILPLLIFTAFLPATIDPQKLIKSWIGYFLKYVFPIFIVLILVMAWQKVLAPQFFEDISRLRFNPAHILRNLYTWLSVFAFQLPGLFLKSISYFSYVAVILFTLTGVLFWWGNSSTKYGASHCTSKTFLVICIFSWLSSSLIFILSDESAVSWGYQARGLSSTWFCFAILVACLAQGAALFPRALRLICLLTIYLITSFSIFSFSIQRDKYIESWNLQLFILKDALTLIQEQAIGPNASILANVPRYTPNNYNRELVYSQSWDFPAALALHSQDQVQAGIVVDSRGKDLQNLRIEGEIAMVNDLGKVDFTNLWLYDFEPTTQKGSLSRLRSSEELQSHITNWKK